MNNDKPDIMTAKEVAEYLRLGLMTVYNLANAGVIPGTKLGRCWRFKREDIEKLFGRRLTRPRGRPPGSRRTKCATH